LTRKRITQALAWFSLGLGLLVCVLGAAQAARTRGARAATAPEAPSAYGLWHLNSS
jgi:hypothetical protein